MKKVGTFNQPFRFSTKRYDGKTGTYNYGYRYYSPSISRWFSRDPLGEIAGINLYRFVGNNPVNWIDPYGLLTWKERVGLIFVGGSRAFWKIFGPFPHYMDDILMKPIPGVGTAIMVLDPSELSDPYLGPDGKWYWPDGTPVNPNESPSDNETCN